MNGVHDFGGTDGWGPVQPEALEPPFHAQWERRALALTLAMGATGQWNIDMSRSARESLPPLQYLSSSYYEIWLAGLQRLMLERGLVRPDELAAGHMNHPPLPVAGKLAATGVAAALARGTPARREPSTPARFSAGDTVRMRNIHPHGHTRLPRYVRGRMGTISAVHGTFVFPDAHARSVPAGAPFDESPQWLYTVCFTGPELWGEATDAALQVSVDAWESYIEPCAGAA